MEDKHRDGISRRKIGMEISMIVAFGKNREIGSKNELMWHLPDDFKWFIKHTKHKTVVMGRNTMNSIGKPLKNRRNLVLSSSDTEILAGFEHFKTLSEAINEAKELESPELMIIGGAKLYEFALHYANRLYLTKVNADFPQADTFFPLLDLKQWKLVESVFHPKDEQHVFDFEFQILERI